MKWEGSRASIIKSAAVVTKAAIVAFVLGQFVPGSVHAQEYPNRAISFIATFGAGSNFDQLARVFAERLRAKLGVPVVIENVTGGQGIIAAQRVLNAKSDGYTFLIGNAGIASTPIAMKNAGYKASDFVAIVPLGQASFILYAGSKVPATDIPSMMSYLKSNLKEANSGVLTTSYVSMMLSRKFAKVSGGEITEIGYRSSPEMLVALLANDISMMATTHAIAGQHVAAGKIKAIGVVAEDRTPTMPDLPTFKEMGYPSLVINVWQVIFAKSDVPADILNKIKAASKEIVADPSFLQAMGPTGMEEWKIPFEAVQSLVDKEAKTFGREAEELGIKFN